MEPCDDDAWEGAIGVNRIVILLWLRSRASLSAFDGRPGPRFNGGCVVRLPLVGESSLVLFPGGVNVRLLLRGFGAYARGVAPK